MNHIIIDIGNDFSKNPTGRYKIDSQFSGEYFRDDFIIPNLEKNIKIHLELDNTYGYGSSFLEEVFGGLIRLGYSSNYITNMIKILTYDESLIMEIKEYIHGVNND